MRLTITINLNEIMGNSSGDTVVSCRLRNDVPRALDEVLQRDGGDDADWTWSRPGKFCHCSGPIRGLKQ